MKGMKATQYLPPHPNTPHNKLQSLKLTVFLKKIVFPGGHLSSETAKNHTEHTGHERWGAETSKKSSKSTCLALNEEVAILLKIWKVIVCG